MFARRGRQADVPPRFGLEVARTLADAAAVVVGYPNFFGRLEDVPAIAERFGSETLHFVTHSKGGLDTRGFLSSLVAGPITITNDC